MPTADKNTLISNSPDKGSYQSTDTPKNIVAASTDDPNVRLATLSKEVEYIRSQLNDRVEARKWTIGTIIGIVTVIVIVTAWGFTTMSQVIDSYKSMVEQYTKISDEMRSLQKDYFTQIIVLQNQISKLKTDNQSTEESE